MKEDPWKTHGYFFSVCFGVFMVTLGWFAADFLNIPKGVPLRDALSPQQGALFILLLGACSALAYILARGASHGINWVIRALRESFRK